MLYKPSSVQRRKLTEDVKRCECGQRISKWSYRCAQCEQNRKLEHAKQFIAFEKSGVCPNCGGKLAYNNSLAGTYWIHCIGDGEIKHPWNRLVTPANTATQTLNTTAELHDDDTFKDCNWQYIADADKVDSLKN
jgi:hypothetical protein